MPVAPVKNTHHALRRRIIGCQSVSGTVTGKDSSGLLPPPVDPDVGGACEPWVQEVDAAHCSGPPDSLPQRRVVMETQTLPEPVDGVWGHFTLKGEKNE